jgi:hypothetical protein
MKILANGISMGKGRDSTENPERMRKLTQPILKKSWIKQMMFNKMTVATHERMIFEPFRRKN